MSTHLYRLGRFAVRRRWLVLVSWVLALLVLVVSGRMAGGELHDEFNIPGVESQQALDVLQATFPAQAGARAQVVLHTDSGTLSDPANKAAVAATFAEISSLPHVVGAVDPVAAAAKGAPGVVSADGTIALGAVQYDESAIDLGPEVYDQLQQATTTATKAGMQVEFGGDLANQNERDTPGSEGLGLLAAMIILVIAFGSIIAMGLSIGTALFGLGSGMALMIFVSSFV